MTGFFSSVVRDSRGGNAFRQRGGISVAAGLSTAEAGGLTAAQATFSAADTVAAGKNAASTGTGSDRITPADNAGNMDFPVATDFPPATKARVIPESTHSSADAVPGTARQQGPGIQGADSRATAHAVATIDNDAASGSPPPAPPPNTALQTTSGSRDIAPANQRQLEVADTTPVGSTTREAGRAIARQAPVVDKHPADVADNLTTTDGGIGVPVATVAATAAIGNDRQLQPPVPVPSPDQHQYQAVIRPPPPRPGLAGADNADNRVTGPSHYAGNANRNPSPGAGSTRSSGRPQIRIGQVNVVVEGPPAAPGKKSTPPVDQASRLLLRGF